MTETWCGICGQRDPFHGEVCLGCFTTVCTQLTALPGKVRQLPLALVPARGARAERIPAGRSGSPMPVRGDVLSLAGPGSEDVEWAPAREVMQPQVRRWTTVEEVLVDCTVGGRRVQSLRKVTVWHRELALDDGGRVRLIVDADQAGLLPPAEWLDRWVRQFRRAFGHHVPVRSRPARPRPPEQPPAVLPRAALHRLLLFAVRHPQLHAAAAAAVAPTLAWAQRRRREQHVVLGIGPALPYTDRPDDPVADEMLIRYGDAPAQTSADHDVRYLLTWLEQACQTGTGIDVATFAAELRALNAELARVLGDRPDEVWLGRCPAIVTWPGSDRSRPCGAGLWQDPHASQVQCPRCRSTWGPHRAELLHLAGEIRRVWPVDRRRRYDSTDRAALTPPKCPNCCTPVTIDWQDVTAPQERTRWWRPAGVTCPKGCPEAKGLA